MKMCKKACDKEVKYNSELDCYEIELTRGQWALVDKDDIEMVSQYSWQAKWSKITQSYYAVNHSSILMHRLIMGFPDGKQIDHIGGSVTTLDNRKQNLRECSLSENQKNRGKSRNNTSGYKGVSWHLAREKWRAQIKIDNKVIHLGLFTDKNEAALAYNQAAIKYHGEFGVLNVVKEND